MPVYVDEPIYSFGRMKMCHMTADTLSELYEMAASIGVPWVHFQNKRIPHFDICKSKRSLALRFGAVEMTREIRRKQLSERSKG